ncbi:hypothetical protein SFUMM280S_11374 [Streptomyces fumanus]
MPEVNRRRFLQLAGATAGFSALSASIERAAALPANHRTGSIEDVEHIVVLMQENRSFDHYFGALRGVRGFGDPRPVTLDSGKSVWHQTKADGTEVLPFHPDADDLGMQFLEGLPHSWPDGQQAYRGGKYDRWVPAKGTTTMAYLTREDIPFHYALADAFTVCDAYHCSFIGSTDPNRYYMWSGHTGNDGKGGGPVLGNDELGYDWTTYPERLERAGITWKVYQGHRRRPRRRGLLGLDPRRLPRQLRRQLPAVLQQVPQCPAGRPLVRQGPHRHRRQERRRLLRPAARRREGRQAAAGVLDRRARGVLRALQLAVQLRRLVHRPGPGRAHLQPQGVGEDGPVHHLRRERRLLRPRRTAAAAHLRGAGPLHGRRLPRRLPGQLPLRRRPLRTGPAGADAGRLALEQGRLRLLRDLRPHLDRALHGTPLRGARTADLPVAAGHLRRPDLGLRLLAQGQLTGPAARHR